VGDDTKIGAFVEVQKNASIGKRCKISSHTFVCEGVTIEDEVFVGHGVMFINDPHPRAASAGRLQTSGISRNRRAPGSRWSVTSGASRSSWSSVAIPRFE
jgi:tetrahydrodipicolinate N-succinyltransferase